MSEKCRMHDDYDCEVCEMNLGAPMTKSRKELITDAEFRIGKWLSAALDDPEVCDEMKLDIVNWFTAIETIEPSIEAKYAGGWISVEDELPEFGIDVVGRISTGEKVEGYKNIIIRIVYLDDEIGWCDEWGHKNMQVTHWAPLPPKG